MKNYFTLDGEQPPPLDFISGVEIRLERLTDQFGELLSLAGCLGPIRHSTLEAKITRLHETLEFAANLETGKAVAA